MEKPIPCPFCGKEEGSYNTLAWVCVCGAAGPDFCATEAEAIAAWNKRCSAPISTEKYDALVDRIDAYIAHKKNGRTLPEDGPEVQDWISTAAMYWQQIAEARSQL